jgi:NAD(P)-dependent dehydrogenase (short-subunit alcohol dehydrogenase family)
MAKILITGANRGIGLELAKQFSGRGEDVIGACRQSSPSLDALKARIIEGVDVTSDASVAELADKLDGERLDCLVNNAGILDRDSLDALDFKAAERQFAVNALGPLRVTAALKDNLSGGSRVFIITSRMGSVGDNTSGGSYGYRMSKAAVNIAGKSLSEDLKPMGIGVFLLHPGYVATDMTGHGGTDVRAAAANLIQRMDELDISSTGCFRHAEGYELPW